MLELFQEQFHSPAMRKTQPSREPASGHSDHKNVNSHCQVTKQNRVVGLRTPRVQIEVQIGENGSRIYSMINPTICKHLRNSQFRQLWEHTLSAA